MQVNTETKENPKPAFINESLTLLEKEDLVDPIRKYIDVFAWNYEDILGLEPQIVVH